MREQKLEPGQSNLFIDELRSLSDQCFISRKTGPATLTTHITCINRFYRFLEQRDLTGWQEIDPELFKDFDNWHEEHYKKNSIVMDNQAIKVFFSWLTENGYPLHPDITEKFRKKRNQLQGKKLSAA